MQVFYDSHVHTRHSPDSQQPLPQICETAIERGLRGFTVTDHADMGFLEDFHTFEEIKDSIAEAKAANAHYGDRLHILCGVELGEFWDDPESAKQILNLTNYDVVLGSVHGLHPHDFYSKTCFDEAQMPADKLADFLKDYFCKVLAMAQKEDFDILTHLTCPLRYINGKYHRDLSARPCMDLITEILKCVIHRQKSLEVNTSGVNSFYGELLPDREIIKRYYDLGGQMVTLGSDAHTCDRVGNAFCETAGLLKDIGFPGYYYYEQRKPCLVPWESTPRLD
ncbi:MAG: histidinol-phosphatase HisJ family protein [Oscillibacter sp.]|jgi:histidinol-phosphatase (PHP family)|nr:histidinol-phosphatase HisJ family protein [Oscillibacter sp.]